MMNEDFLKQQLYLAQQYQQVSAGTVTGNPTSILRASTQSNMMSASSAGGTTSGGGAGGSFMKPKQFYLESKQ